MKQRKSGQTPASLDRPVPTPATPRRQAPLQAPPSAFTGVSPASAVSYGGSAVPAAAPLKGAKLGNARARDVSVTRPQPYIREMDFVDNLYKPHTVTMGIVLLSALLFLGKWIVSTSEVDNVKLGLMAAAWTFIVFGALHLPDGIMVRPHPMLWRGVLATAVIYLLFVVFMIFQSLPTIRKIFTFMDPALERMPPQQDYATDCRITTPEEPWKFFHTVFDEFIIAHALGYWAKTLVLRDWRIVTMVSVGFELIEVSLQHILPNFAECWWDHVLIDICICNALGTVAGILTLRYLEAKEFNWAKLSEIKTLKGKAGRLLRQLGPRTFEHFDWHFFDSFKRFLQMCLLLVVMFTQEMNCFTLKHMLHMKPSHPLVVGRLAMWGVIAIPGLREFYDYISDPSCDRIGTTAWVGSAALVFETLLSFKIINEGGYFREATPSYIALPWLLTIAIFAVWVVLYFGTRVKSSFLGKALLRLLILLCAAVLFAMCCMGNKDTQWYQQEFEAFVADKGLWPLL